MLDERTSQYLHDVRSGKVEPRTDYGFKLKPFPHQRVIFEYFRYVRNLFLNGDQGVGKTKCVIDYLDFEAERKGLQRCLVVVPNALKYNWLREYGVHGRVYGDSVFVVPDSKPKRERLLAKQAPGVYIVNYEKVRSMESSGDALHRFKWDWVVADESSSIKHRQSKQSKAMHKLADNCPEARRVIMTGTPVTQGPLDLYSQFRFLDKSIFGSSFVNFSTKYARFRLVNIPGRKPFQEVVGYQGLEELSERAYSIGVKYDKEECLDDLPPKSETVRVVTMPPQMRKDYKSLAEELLLEVKTSAGSREISVPNVLAKLTKLRQVSSGFVYEGEGDNRVVIRMRSAPKLLELKSMIEDSYFNGPFLVWTIFREESEMIMDLLDSCGVPNDSIHGGVPKEDRQSIVDQFQEGPKDEVRALICQTSICAYGLTLTAAADSVVVSRSPNLEHWLQLQDRIHRIGQERPCLITSLVVDESVDVMDMEILEGKLDVAKVVTGIGLETLMGKIGRMKPVVDPWKKK